MYTLRPVLTKGEVGRFEAAWLDGVEAIDHMAKLQTDLTAIFHLSWDFCQGSCGQPMQQL
jgi:hypothetical protein